MNTIHIVGGGLAGTEAAWQALLRGHKVKLYEMRPHKRSPAHKTDNLGELVCSNSFKSLDEGSASGLLKKEMSYLSSLVVSAAKKSKVPAGQALAVDRVKFSREIMQALLANENFELVTGEVTEIPTEESLVVDNDVWIIATGPLTSDTLSNEIAVLCGSEKDLHFYDAIAPVIDGSSIDKSEVFSANRWADDQVDGDYLNIPLNKEEYEEFITEVENAEKVPHHEFEEVKYFESCLPIEVMIERGKDTLRFGPMKPAGLTNPKTGRWSYANIQLRMEDVNGSMYSMVGFQTKMKWPEQKRIFSKLPGLKNADFLKLGSIHRNTYLNSPEVLNPDLSFIKNKRVLLAGQISGVEGYTESASMGLLAGRIAADILEQIPSIIPPPETMMGALFNHVTKGNKGDFVPMNANLGLLPPIPKERGVSKSERKSRQCAKAWGVFESRMS